MPDRFGRGIQYAPAHHWIAGIVMLVMFAVLIGVIVWAVVRITRTDALRRGPALSGPPPPPAMTAPAEDAALTTLRMRYARGEIDRDEYVRVASDLGITPPPETP
jgi:putative membrane protein